MAKYVLVSLEEEKAGKIANILGNKTARKIIDFLSETKEASESDIAEKLNMPMNTAEYNLKKLLDVNLVEKTSNFLWSRKGKKIVMYKLAKKHIIISPKTTKPSFSKLKSIIPSLIVAGIFTFLIRFFYTRGFAQTIALKEADFAAETAMPAVDSAISIASNNWIWFLAGAIITIILFVIFNWKKL